MLNDIIIDFVYNNNMEKFNLVLCADCKGHYNILEIYNERGTCVNGIFLDSFQIGRTNLLAPVELRLLIHKIINNREV